jgi:hypothetical protein
LIRSLPLFEKSIHNYIQHSPQTVLTFILTPGSDFNIRNRIKLVAKERVIKNKRAVMETIWKAKIQAHVLRPKPFKSTIHRRFGFSITGMMYFIDFKGVKFL